MIRAQVLHPGTQYSFRMVQELQKRDRLDGFHTSFAVRREGILGCLCLGSASYIRRRLSNRQLEGIPANKLHLHPLPELLSVVRRRLEGRASEGNLHARNQRFQRLVSDRILSNAGAVIGFDTSSWEIAKRCGDLGVPFVLDQSIGHPDSKTAVYAGLRERFPLWADSVEWRDADVRAAESIEHDKAVSIVAASSFTVRTLVAHGVQAGKIRLNSYGVDAHRFTTSEVTTERPVRFIFVGSITARKGVPILIDAWRRLRSSTAELWLVGPVADSIMTVIKGERNLRVFGAVPHAEVPRLLHQCDVFVFPSFFEGFGLVIPEAMACGLPVISTDATAAPDLYSDGTGGWIVPVGDADALAHRMEFYLRHPRHARDMGRVARQIAERHTWEAYGDRWADILDSTPGATTR